MRLHIGIALFAALLGWTTAVVGQGLYEQDYFKAHESSQTELLLRSVEKNHMGEAVLKALIDEEYDRVYPDAEYTLRRFPNHPKALMLMGTLSRLTGNPELAMEAYVKALNLFPQYGLTHAQYGFYLLEIGDVDAAISELKRATELEEELAQAHAWLAQAYFETGEQELGQQAARRANQLGYEKAIPSSPSSRN